MLGAFPCHPLEGALHKPGLRFESCLCTAVWLWAGCFNSKNTSGAALARPHRVRPPAAVLACDDPSTDQCRHLHLAVGALPDP